MGETTKIETHERIVWGPFDGALSCPRLSNDEAYIFQGPFPENRCPICGAELPKPKQAVSGEGEPF